MSLNIFIPFQPPEIDICSMLALKYYDIKVSSKGVEVFSGRTNDTATSFKHSDDPSSITFTVNVTVVDIKGQRSIPTIAKTNIGMQNVIPITVWVS